MPLPAAPSFAVGLLLCLLIWLGMASMDYERLLGDHTYEEEVLDILFERSRAITRAISRLVRERQEITHRLEERGDVMTVFEVLECDCRLAEVDRLLPLFEAEEKFLDWLTDEIIGVDGN